MFPKMFLFIALALSICAIPSSAQTKERGSKYRPASPQVGWDSLRAAMLETGIGGGAILGRAYDALLLIDSGGHLESLSITPYNRAEFNRPEHPAPTDFIDSVLIRHLTRVLESAAWIPATRKGNPIRSELDIPIIFPYRIPANDASSAKPLLIR